MFLYFYSRAAASLTLLFVVLVLVGKEPFVSFFCLNSNLTCKFYFTYNFYLFFKILKKIRSLRFLFIFYKIFFLRKFNPRGR